jgi:hypothetical protein
MSQTLRFNLARRVRQVAYPLAIIVGLGVLLAVYQPAPGSWKLWTALAAMGLLGLGAAKFVLDGRQPLTLEADGVHRAGVSVPFAAAHLELRVQAGAQGPSVNEVIVWMPVDRAPGKLDVRFDPSLDGFDEAVTAVLAQVPEERVVVTALGSADVRDERREAVLERYRPPPPPEPTPIERALAMLGKPKLVPPSQRN